MKKRIGIIVWLIGCLCFAFALPSLLSQGDTASKILVIIGLPVLTGFLLYNWLYGPQKGHSGHLFNIVLYCGLAVLILIRHRVSGAIFVAGIGAYLCGICWLVLRVSGPFRRDAEAGIRRNYFVKG